MNKYVNILREIIDSEDLTRFDSAFDALEWDDFKSRFWALSELFKNGEVKFLWVEKHLCDGKTFKDIASESCVTKQAVCEMVKKMLNFLRRQDVKEYLILGGERPQKRVKKVKNAKSLNRDGGLSPCFSNRTKNALCRFGITTDEELLEFFKNAISGFAFLPLSTIFIEVRGLGVKGIAEIRDFLHSRRGCGGEVNE